MNKGKTSNFSGITLIALVITVIVLLILAGISISMLSGDNGILQRATDAKIKTERQSVVEQARTDVLGYQAENKGTNLQKSQLQSVLETYFKSVPDLTDMSESEILNTQLQTLDKYGNHSIAIKEIFDGILSGDNQTKTATADEINAKIGTVVTGYSVAGLEWQVYYADDNETFLISTTLAKTNWQVPARGEGKSSDYNGSADVKNSSFGMKWNSKWLETCSTDSSLENAKATAYLCDSKNWEDYVISPATYAVGGPSLELLLASWNKSQGDNCEVFEDEITSVGYGEYKDFSVFPITESYSNGAYNCGSNCWLSSPHKLRDGVDLSCMYSYGGLGSMSNLSNTNAGIRPLVSIPSSKISIDGNTVTVLP